MVAGEPIRALRQRYADTATSLQSVG